MKKAVVKRLADRDYILLLHLYSFRFSFYFDDVYITFQHVEKNKSALFDSLYRLCIRKFVAVESPPDTNQSLKEKLATTTFMLTNLGRLTAEQFVNAKNL